MGVVESSLCVYAVTCFAEYLRPGLESGGVSSVYATCPHAGAVVVPVSVKSALAAGSFASGVRNVEYES